MKKKRGRDCKAAVIDQNLRKRVVYERGGGNKMDEDGNKDLGVESKSSRSESDTNLEAGWDGGLLSKEDIILYWKRRQDVVFPTVGSRLPENIGEAIAVSMKAAQWHVLFFYVIALLILEL